MNLQLDNQKVAAWQLRFFWPRSARLRHFSWHFQASQSEPSYTWQEKHDCYRSTGGTAIDCLPAAAFSRELSTVRRQPQWSSAITRSFNGFIQQGVWRISGVYLIFLYINVDPAVFIYCDFHFLASFAGNRIMNHAIPCSVASKYENLTVFHRMFSKHVTLHDDMLHWIFLPGSIIDLLQFMTHKVQRILAETLSGIQLQDLQHVILALDSLEMLLDTVGRIFIYDHLCIYDVLVKAVIISLAPHTSPWPRVVEGSYSLTVTSGDEQMHQQKETSCYHSGPAIEKTLLGAIYGCIKQINHELLDLVMPKLLQNGVQV